MSANSYIDQMNALSFDDEKKNMREKYKPDMQADIDLSNAGYDSQISNTQNYFDKQIGDAKTAYDTEYQKNAVQKLINEKKIAETNANLGLTDSGLNRTQQTAVQLSYANQKGKLDLARQSALDNLTLAMTDAITTLQNQKAASARDITKQWNDYADTQAQNIYNTKYNGYVDMHNAQVEADASVQKAAIEASGKAEETNKTRLWYYTGTYDEDDNPIFRNSEGKTQAFGVGVNPYTGTKHKDAEYGTFSNGYQPNNIGGKKLKAQSEYEVYVNGKKQSVWSHDGGKTLWAWDGSINEYVDVTSKKDELKK